MSTPRWARALLRFLAPRHHEDDVVGDLEEAHGNRVERRGRVLAWLLTSLEGLDMGFTILRDRIRRKGPPARSPSEASSEDVLTGVGISWLDFKLGFRMLVKYPGLTIVGSLAIAFAISLGAGMFEFITDFTYPKLPFDGGDRIVELRNRDLATGRPDPRALHDFVAWRDELRTVEEIGAYRTFQRNLITERGTARPLLGAELTATALSIPRVPPLLGRLLSEADEVPGAPSVVLISHDVWQGQFGRDPDVVGQTVRLASEHATIIGVMPKGFAWPWSHSLWAPLRLNVLDYERGESAAVQITGRLAPGAILEEAQAELTAIGLRTAADHPESHGELRPEVVPYGKLSLPITGIGPAAFLSLNVLFFLALILLVCGNVALLLFARTAAREGEIVVRSALGASRGRIVAQLFAEALVLGGVAAVVGLAGAELGLSWVMSIMRRLGEGFGFWFSERLSETTIAYALMFTLLAAVVSGVGPALKVTGRGVQAQLQRAGTGGSGLEFGRFWTVVIVTQIAITVCFVPIIVVIGFDTAEIRSSSYGFPAQEYLFAEFAVDGEISSMAELGGPEASGNRVSAEFQASYNELKLRFAEEPGVSAVTAAGQIPGAYHPRRFIEVDGPSAPVWSPRGHRAQTTSVDLDFFDALGASIVSGRNFDAADLESGQRVAVVNEDFARFILEDRNPIGRRFAFNEQGRENPDAPNPGPWFEIVGVVRQIAMTINPDLNDASGIYLLLGTDEVYPIRLAIRVGRDPESFAPRLRELVGDLDPNLLLTDVRPLDESAWALELTYRSWFWVILGAGGIGLLLATAGIYSTMSFTVSRRTREIGIRVALGAERERVVWAIFSRAFKQITLGVVAGGVLIAGFLMMPEIDYRPKPFHAVIFAGYLTVMLCVCGLACIVPTQRALGVEPTEALRAEG
jgi:predicted permease